jgi:hypothetical protein
MEDKKITAVIEIIETIKTIIETKETNIMYSTFDSIEDLVFELDTHVHKLNDKDFSKISDLILLFAPTSDLQEISMSSGWGKQFLEISERFDHAIKELLD